MDTKYYIPDISEFHVGFEYEHCHSSIRFVMLDLRTGDRTNETEPKEIWEKSVFTGNEFDIWKSSFEFDDSLRDGQIRVKYLDKEDIESFGFTKTIEDQYYKDDFELLIDDDLFIQIIKDDGFIFQGAIKNKSELRQILKMIGYEN
jgi:hypothetical protein